MENESYSIKETIKKVIKNIEEKNAKINKKIEQVWERVVGEEIEKGTEIVEFKNGVLKVKANNSSFFFKINIKKREIITRMNSIAGEKKVKDIRINV